MYKNTKFIKSLYIIKKLSHKNIEISFIGRSNSGKSSAINSITQKKISLTSKKPGKTCAINFFKIKKNYYFTDTPGYGYAKINKSNLIKIKFLIKSYIIKRKNITGIILMIDSKIYLKKIDYTFIKLIKNKNIHILLTKIDKFKNKYKKKFNNIIKDLKKINNKNITHQFFSIKRKVYINKIKIKIKQWIYL